MSYLISYHHIASHLITSYMHRVLNPAYDTCIVMHDRLRRTCPYPCPSLNSKDPLPGLIRLSFMLIMAALCYIICVVGDAGYSFPIRMLAAIMFGVCQALPLLHCMVWRDSDRCDT